MKELNAYTKSLGAFTPALLTLALAGLSPLPAQADSATDQRIKALETELQKLKTQVEVQSKQVKSQGTELQALAYPSGATVISKGDGKSLKFTSVDEKYSLQVGGRVQADAAIYDADTNDFGDGTKFRRVFLDVRGTLDKDWNYRVQYDFARPNSGDSSARGLRDAWLQYTGFGPYPITIGSFREYIGLEHLTGSIYTTFIERGVTDLFSADRHIGLGVGTYRPHWTANIGVFGERPEGDVAGEGDEGWDLAGRFTWAPIARSGELLHLGVASRLHTPDESTTELRLRDRPESNITDVRLIDTNTLTNVEHTQTLGLEAAVINGPFSAQAEYLTTRIERSVADDLDFDGWYVYGSWFLTGESRVYKTKDAVFDRISPLDKKTGAWEVALRYSNADLTDGSVIGGEQDNLTLGLNWYATSNIRFAANYIHLLDLDRPGSIYDGQALDTLLARAQIDF